MQTDKTVPLKPITQIKPAKKSSPEAAKAAKARSASENRNVKLSESTERAIAELMPSPGRRFRRFALQLFAAGITLGGVIAWIDMRSPITVESARPTIDMVSAPVTTGAADSIQTETTVDVDALRSVAGDVASAVSLPEVAAQPPSAAPVRLDVQVEPVPAPAPATAPREMTIERKTSERKRPIVQSRITKPMRRPAVRRHVEAEMPATPSIGAELAVLAVATPAAAELIAPELDEPAQTTTSLSARALAIRYGAVGRDLRKLDKQIGRENTNDLWAAYRVIRIADAVRSQERRDEAAETLRTIQEAILERR